uniref:Bm520 n=1 Tax=Brugia malayi TaxID=6279 RepID=A0A0J9XXI9_BRUMA|nr:Bm520 [Brugia malayi]
MYTIKREIRLKKMFTSNSIFLFFSEVLIFCHFFV